jgi:hypothetical protein
MNFFFASEDDKRMVWVMGTVNLKPGVLRLFEWTKDFNMHKHRNTHAQVWIRLLELPQEYWMDRTLREIASAVGTPLLIDNATSKRIYGHYARILVDMDFSRQLFHEITVEREGYAFQVEVAYEWLPEFCTHCHTLGHDVSSCRWLYPQKDKTVHKERNVQGKKPVSTPKENWVPIKDNPSGIGSSLAFAAPQKEVAPVPIQQDITVTLAGSNRDIGNNNILEEDITEVQHQSYIPVEDNNVTQHDMGTNMNIPLEENSDQMADTTIPSEAVTHQSMNSDNPSGIGSSVAFGVGNGNCPTSATPIHEFRYSSSKNT